MKRAGITALLSGALVLWVGATAGWPGLRWRVWERGVEDQLLLLRGPRRPPPSVVLVAIDDATLQQGAWFESAERIPAWAQGIGSLPWPRAAYGRLAEKLLEAGAAGVAINVVFEGASARGPADDTAMARILERHRGRIALAEEMLEGSDAQGAGSLTLVRPDRYLPAIGGPEALGLTNIISRRPGRRTPHPDAYGMGLLPAQGVQGLPSLASRLLQLAGRSSRQDDVRAALNLYGPEGSFRRIPAWEVLDPERWGPHPQRQALQGAMVLVGAVISQGDDGYPSPFGPISGLEVLATATANSLDGSGLRSWPGRAWQRALLAMLPMLAGAGAALLLTRLGRRLWVLGGLLVLVVGVGVGLLWQANLWLPLLAPSLGLVLLGVVYGGDAYLREERERRRLRRTFERYVAPSVVEEILSDPDGAQGILRGRLLEVTVLMSDIRGFTTLTQERSRQGHSELHVRQLNEYLGAMVEVVTAHGGTVDKFIGDAVMAVFGSPVSRGVEEEARQATRCALAMRRELARLNRRWEEAGIARLDNGVGLASGQAMVGQIGSPRRMEFTVIGDTVNLAARLEALTRKVEASVLCDGRTAELLAGESAVAVRSLGPQEVKGLGPVEVFTPAEGVPPPAALPPGDHG